MSKIKSFFKQFSKYKKNKKIPTMLASCAAYLAIQTCNPGILSGIKEDSQLCLNNASLLIITKGV